MRIISLRRHYVYCRIYEIENAFNIAGYYK